MWEPNKTKGDTMTQTLYTEQQLAQLKQNKFIMMGGITSQKDLSMAEIKKLESDYRDMYYGLTSIHWSKGVTLGMAWQHALGQMESYIMSKAKVVNNPVFVKLLEFHKTFKKDMSKHIMKCQGRESETKLTPELRELFAKDGTEMTQKGKDALNQTYQKFMPQQKIENLSSVQHQSITNQKAQTFQLKIWALKQLNQKVA